MTNYPEATLKALELVAINLFAEPIERGDRFGELGRRIIAQVAVLRRIEAAPSPPDSSQGEPVALPVYVDSIKAECGRGQYDAYALFDAKGRILCDTLNADDVMIHEEPDEESLHVWDETGRARLEWIATRLNTTPPPSSPQVAVQPIQRDEDYDRTYYQLPGGWEIQTKGRGSSFRICDTKTGQRLNIPEAPYVFGWLEQMAKEIHAACAAPQSAPKAAEPQWQPIETAPKDGTLILVAGGDLYRPAIVWYARDTWAGDYASRVTDQFPYTFTIWTPLPTPTEQRARSLAKQEKKND